MSLNYFSGIWLLNICLFLKLEPENTEEYISYLKDFDRLDEAAQRLAFFINSEEYKSRHGKSKHQVRLLCTVKLLLISICSCGMNCVS
jgi:hypothetical protein